MTKTQDQTLTKDQLVQIKALAATLTETATLLSNLFSRRHPSLDQAEFMIHAAHRKIHTTLENLKIDF
jgi:hypothetical protein